MGREFRVTMGVYINLLRKISLNTNLDSGSYVIQVKDNLLYYYINIPSPFSKRRYSFPTHGSGATNTCL